MDAYYSGCLSIGDYKRWCIQVGLVPWRDKILIFIASYGNSEENSALYVLHACRLIVGYPLSMY